MASLEIDILKPWLHTCRIAENVLLVNGIFIRLEIALENESEKRIASRELTTR